MRLTTKELDELTAAGVLLMAEEKYATDTTKRTYKFQGLGLKGNGPDPAGAFCAGYEVVAAKHNRHAMYGEALHVHDDIVEAACFAFIREHRSVSLEWLIDRETFELYPAGSTERIGTEVHHSATEALLEAIRLGVVS